MQSRQDLLYIFLHQDYFQIKGFFITVYVIYIILNERICLLAFYFISPTALFAKCSFPWWSFLCFKCYFL